MSYLELFTSATLFFSGYQKSFEEAKYVVLGVPFDATSTYRSGARFAPTAIREASLNIETYSFRSNVDVEDLNLHDVGDLHVSGRLEETLRRVYLVCQEIIGVGKIPVIIGGEHTITLGASKSIDGDFALISFDAHLDLRDTYMDERICHATFMRRINEEVKPKKIVGVGTRAACKEEIIYLSSVNNIEYITSHRIMRTDLEEILQEIRDTIRGCDKVYITLDMDVLDPAYAPAVQNPEPEGLSTSMLLDILLGVCDHRLAIFDLVEVTPHYDHGVTSVQAAKIIFEVLSHLHKMGVR